LWLVEACGRPPLLVKARGPGEENKYRMGSYLSHACRRVDKSVNTTEARRFYKYAWSGGHFSKNNGDIMRKFMVEDGKDWNSTKNLIFILIFVNFFYEKSIKIDFNIDEKFVFIFMKQFGILDEDGNFEVIFFGLGYRTPRWLVGVLTLGGVEPIGTC
jgi:hypothetical protein